MLLPLDKLIQTDLDYLIGKARPEFETLAGGCLWLTGAAGFLGYYLCKAIHHWNSTHDAGEKIHLLAIDNFQRGVPQWLDEIRSADIELVKHDVTHPIPENWAPCDSIIHAASIASPVFYRKHPLATIDANVTGLRHMLDYAAARTGQVRHMLFFSTSEIYGDPLPDAIPTPETFRGLVSSTGPRACYDESKRLGETLCVVFAEQHGVPVTIARPFNNYGPGLKLEDGRVLPDFAKDVLNGRDIVMLSDGSPTRTFCYITDALAGYLKVLVRGRPGEPYNIGLDAEETSVRDLAKNVADAAAELWSYKGKVVHQPSAEQAYLTDNPNRRCPDLTKARAELDYAPEVTLSEGLRKSLNWYYYNRESARES